MEQFLFYFIHWGIPILIGISLFIVKPRSKFGLISGLACNVAILGFLYNWGQWPIAAFLFFKYFLLILIGFCIYKLINRFRCTSKGFPKSLTRNIKNSFLLLFAVLFVILFAKTYSGMNYVQPSVSLEFPLKDGTYYIASGGSNGVLNNHYGKGSLSQRFALDINRIGDNGRISKGFGHATNEQHFVYGVSIYAPCSGKIIELENNIADNTGTNMNVSAQNGRGNFVVIDCEGTVISLVHLKKGSIMVKLGDEVQAGQLIGAVGNSGFSQEPHLHLQAARWDKDSLLLGVPMEFDGRLPYRNMLLVH